MGTWEQSVLWTLAWTCPGQASPKPSPVGWKGLIWQDTPCCTGKGPEDHQDSLEPRGRWPEGGTCVPWTLGLMPSVNLQMGEREGKAGVASPLAPQALLSSGHQLKSLWQENLEGSWAMHGRLPNLSCPAAVGLLPGRIWTSCFSPHLSLKGREVGSAEAMT